MSFDDSVYWNGRAKEMLARAEQMDECVTRDVLCRLAEAYEGFARKAGKQTNWFPKNPVGKALLPAERRSPPRRKDRLAAHVRQLDEFATELVLRRVADACECLTRASSLSDRKMSNANRPRALLR
jgi:hypothetical protein